MGALAAAGIGAAGSILGGITGGKGAAKAAKAQAKAAQAGIDEQHAEFQQEQQNFAPYLGAGTTGLDNFMALLGVGPGIAATQAQGAYAGPSAQEKLAYLQANSGPKSAKQIQKYLSGAGANADPDAQVQMAMQLAGSGGLSNYNSWLAAHPATAAVAASDGVTSQQQQQTAIDALKASPLFTSLYGTGQDTILQNASATGGLRGGNTQNSLAQFGSNLLSTVIQNQLASYSGLANMGLGATSNISSLGQQSATNVANLLGQKGQAQSAGILGQTAALQSMISGISGAAGGLFGGSSGAGGAGANTALMSGIGGGGLF